MDLIYFVLSIYLRLFQTALPLSQASASQQRRLESQQWAMWIPVVGWVSVSVRFVPTATWLTWRVTAVERLPHHRRKQKSSWGDQNSPSDKEPSIDSRSPNDQPD